MKLYLTLLWAETREHPGRLIPGLLAVCVSVALIIWMMGSYDALVGEFDDEADAYLGHYACSLVPAGEDAAGHVPAALARAVAADPSVEEVNRCAQTKLPIGRNERGKSFDDALRERMGIPSQSPVLVGTDASDCPYELEEGSWPDMAAEQGRAGVLGSASAAFFKVGVGDVLVIRSGEKVTEVTIVGIVHQLEAFPDISSSLRQGRGPALASLFVPVKLYERITQKPFGTDLLNIRLKEGADAAAFRKRWEGAAASAGAAFADTDVIRRRLEDNRSMRRMKDSAASAAGMVLFACVFIMFTTLSMGVIERTRSLALLRALGLAKRQVAWLVAGESLLLAIPSFVIGCAAGVGLLVLTRPPGLSGELPMPSAMTLLIAFGCSAGGALLAALVPAWRATRLLPVEATMEAGSAGRGSSPRASWLAGLAGLLCWCVQPAVLLLPGLEPSTRQTLFVWLGYPGLLAGVILLAPAVVMLVEKACRLPMAWLMRVNAQFLKDQLTVHMTRTAGTTIALTVGLGLYMAVQIWGYSMVVPFKPDSTMPDTLVSFLHTGFEGEGLQEVMAQPPLNGEGMCPIAVEEPDIDPRQLASPAFHSVEQKSVVVAGIPVGRMMEGDHASLRPVFVQGGKDAALRQIREGRSLLIPDTFARATGLGPGDSLGLVAPSTNEVQEWKVAAVVALPGWHWLTKTSGMRVRRGHFIAALAIADEGQLRKAFGDAPVRFFWGDAGGGQSSREWQASLQAWLDRQRHDPLARPLVKVTGNGDLARRVHGMADRTISAMSKLPLIALIIASLALMNTVLASVNARRREFELMHAVGVTRGSLFRLVLGESLMIGLSAVALSFLFGVTAAWGSIEVLRYGYVFGGVTPPLSIPWTHLMLGAGITLGLCLLPLLLVRFGRKMA